MEENIKNVIIINDGFSKEQNFLDLDSEEFNLYNLKYNDIHKVLKRIEILKCESNIIILHKDLIAQKIHEKINDMFFHDYGLKNPYMIFILSSEDDISEIKNSAKIYSYFISKNIKSNINPNKNNLNLIIKMIFEKIKYTKRLNEYIVNSFKIIAELQRANKDLVNLSRKDYLTNILNRRAFYEALETERRRNLRNFQKLSLRKNKNTFYEDYAKFTCLIFDIDHFKNINDQYGHLIGDQVLRKLGELLISKNFLRQTDLGSRFGGEEFCVILPETNAQKAKIPAERLRNLIRNLVFTNNEKKKFHITVSIGISEFNINDKSSDEIIQRSDQALYYAKENGRNRVIVYEEIFKKQKPTKNKKELKELSDKVDYYTNVLNRESFYEELEKETKRTIRHNQKLKQERANEIVEEKLLENYGKFCCMVFDIDNFKNVNQKYSYKTGDKVLKTLGEILISKNIFRLSDIISRVGGEEFCIILPETNIKNTINPAERLKKILSQTNFISYDKKKFHITISIGISEFKETDKSGDEIIARADQALAYAKQNGKNRIAVYEELFRKS